MAEYRDRIHADPSILSGKPVIKGTRISVELVLSRLSEGASTQSLLEAWPNLSAADIQAALAYSAAVIAHEELLVG
jgi:uncharacterized protein (DUF433 family)